MSETLKSIWRRAPPDGHKMALTIQLTKGGAGIVFLEHEPVSDVCTKLRDLARELEAGVVRRAGGAQEWTGDTSYCPPGYLDIDK